MKTLILILALSSFFISCNDDTTQTEKAKMGAPAQNSEVQPDQNAAGGIAEENDMCICTKDYRPVCGSNGVTYPNPCQAGCEDIKEFEEGPCPPDSDN